MFWRSIKDIPSSKSEATCNVTGDVWSSQFKELLNTECDIDSDILKFVEFNMGNFDSSNDICTCVENECVQLNSKFTIEEVLTFVFKLQNGRSAGIDGICNEMLKNCSRFLAPYLVSVFNDILDSGHGSSI